MGLFSKKKAEEKEELPPLKFPEFPKQEMPSYESMIPPQDTGMQKRTVMQQPPLNIPIRKPVMPKRFLEEEPEQPRPEKLFEERPRIEERPKPMIKQTESMPEKTLFIKVDRYKEVMNKMNEIRAKIADADKIMQRLNELKAEEDEKMKIWQDDINRIKDTLISMDRTLFE